MMINTEKLVDSAKLLELLFPVELRPTTKWLYHQRKRRRVPYYQIGHFVMFDVDKVRAALEKNCEIRAR